ncbi:MAG: replicative DNA helicase [Legionellales bacterium]|nr:replicative DNA helicase [Legionellales bacterium]
MVEPIKKSFTNDTETTALKVPPHSIEAEQAVLGGIFLDKDAWDKVADKVHEDDFYRKDHRIIFRAISHLSNEGQPCDIVTVTEWLENHQLLDEAGGMSSIASLAENTPSAMNIKSYADIIRKRSILRQLISVTSNINDTVFNPQGKTSEEILELAEQLVFDIAEQEERSNQSYQNISAYTQPVMNRIQELKESDSPITGIATGFKDLDFKTGGFQRSDLIIIAGRPSMGKTALAVNIAENTAIKAQLSVAIFSMEMPADQLTMRMMSSLASLDQHKVRTGDLDGEDFTQLHSTVNLLSNTKMFIDDTAALTPAELRARCRRIHREYGLDLVVVDYLQLMQVPSTSENRATEISEISRSLKAMAKELKIPVVALSQLNRSLESRQDKRPVMSDLRESGAIEQDADVIIFIYRDEVYDPDSVDKGMAEIILSKQRNGPIGKVKLAFRGQYTRFDDFIEDPLKYDNFSAGGNYE